MPFTRDIRDSHFSRVIDEIGATQKQIRLLFSPRAAQRMWKRTQPHS
jgi:hypothetical protein